MSSSLRRGVAHPLELALDRFVLFESVGSSGSVGMRASSPWVIIHGWRFRPLRVIRLLGFLCSMRAQNPHRSCKWGGRHGMSIVVIPTGTWRPIVINSFDTLYFSFSFNNL